MINHTSATGADLRLEKLKRVYGWDGYGVYWGLVELIDQQSSASINDDYDALGWILRIDDVQIIQAVVNDFDLFEVDAGTIRLATTQEKTSTSGLSFAQKGALASAAKRKQKKESTQTTNADGAPRVTTQPKSDAPEILSFDELVDATPPTCQTDEEAVKETRDDWNEVFKGTRAVVRSAIFSTAAERVNVKEARREFSRAEIKEAFQAARSDSFNWQFGDVIKPNNIRRLLTKKDKNGNGTAQPNIRNDTARQSDGVSFDAIFGASTDLY